MISMLAAVELCVIGKPLNSKRTPHQESEDVVSQQIATEGELCWKQASPSEPY
jgi:hypothetical protein